MADNITLDPGTGGSVVATDDDGVAHHQYVKVEFGADNTQTKVTSSVGLPTDPLDRAARDLGKVDIAMGQAAHDAAATTFDPVLVGGYASAAAPTNVSLDGDAVRAWYLQNGAQATVLTAAGALIGGDATNGLDVDVIRVPAPLNVVGGGTEAAALRVTLASDSTGVVSVDDNGGALTVDNGGTFAVQIDAAAVTSLALIDDPVFVAGTDTYTEAASKGNLALAVRRDADTTLVNATNEFAPLQVDANGRLKVEAFSGETLPVSLTSTTITGSVAVTNAGVFAVQVDAAIPAGTNNIGDVDVLTVPAPLSTTGGGTEATALRVTVASDSTGVLSVDDNGSSITVDGNVGVLPITSGGCSVSHLISAATTNATNVKASAGQLYGWNIFNTNAAIRYVKLHNNAGTPTAGAGVVMTIGVPASGGTNITLPTGIAFGTGIAFTTVTGVADADTTAVGASDLSIDIHFK